MKDSDRLSVQINMKTKYDEIWSTSEGEEKSRSKDITRSFYFNHSGWFLSEMNLLNFDFHQKVTTAGA